MKNQLGFLAFALFCAGIVAFGVTRPVQPVALQAQEQEPPEVYQEYINRGAVVTYRDGAWAELRMANGELTYEYDPNHLYGEPQR